MAMVREIIKATQQLAPTWIYCIYVRNICQCLRAGAWMYKESIRMASNLGDMNTMFVESSRIPAHSVDRKI